MTRLHTPGFRPPALNAIIDADAAARAGWSLPHLADAFVAGGARFLQVRVKERCSSEMLRLATAVVERAQAAGATVIVNDRADIARLAHADGVHVGQEDLAPADVRLIVGGDAIVGVSTHTVAQVDRALSEPVDYLAIGPVFATSTKATGYEAIGLDRVREAASRAHVRGLALVAIGGITLDRAPEVLAAGADSVAVITDLLASGDPTTRVREYIRTLA